MSPNMKACALLTFTVTLALGIIFIADSNEYADAEEDTITIYTLEDLQKIGNHQDYPLDGSYKMINDLYLGMHTGFTPIGTESNPFIGKFDGNNRIIEGLYITEVVEGSTGIFAYVSGDAEIGDIRIGSLNISSYVNVRDVADTIAGFIVGRIVSTVPGTVVISGCFVEGTVTADYIVGGIVGLIESNARILDCQVGWEEEMFLTETNRETTGYSGGIVGAVLCDSTQAVEINNCVAAGYHIQGWDTDIDGLGGIIGRGINVDLIDCLNNGITLEFYTYGTSTSVGGIAGHLESSRVVRCVNYGTLNDGQFSGGDVTSLGGIVGYAGPDVYMEDCINEGMMLAINYDDSRLSFGYAGGMVGFANGTASKPVTLVNCDNLGEIFVIANNCRVGGIAGFVRNMVATDCTNSGNVQYETYFSAESTVYVGGIVGRFESSSLSGCTNEGFVGTSSTSNPGFNGSFRYWVGGIVGDMLNGATITGCTNDADISVVVPAGTTYLFIGGLVGQMYEGTSIQDCTHAGSVSVSNDGIAGLFVYAGGVAGVAKGISGSAAAIVNCDSSSTVTAMAANARVGGILGYGKYATVTGCDNTGNVLGSGGSNVFGISDASVRSGGVAGYLENSVLATCTSTGDVSAMTLNSNGLPRAGGIAGSSVMDTSLTGCMASGAITADSGIQASGKAYAGGIAGLTEGTISNCIYGSSSILGSVTSVGFTSGAGGIAGMVGAGSVSSASYADVTAEYIDTTGSNGRAGLRAGFVAKSATVASSASTGTSAMVMVPLS